MSILRPYAVVVALLALSGSIQAADAALPDAAQVKSLGIHPEKVALVGGDAAVQLVVTATLADGRQIDLTHDASYSIADAGTAAVLATGRVLPPVMASATKAKWIREYAEREGLNLSESYAYSDSISDLPMLSIVGHPVAVNPDFRLKQTARQHDWAVLDLK